MLSDGSTKKRDHKIASSIVPAAVCVVLLCFFAWLILGGRSGVPAQIVLPIGYRGSFAIIAHQDFPNPPESRDGSLYVRIPMDGICEVRRDVGMPVLRLFRNNWYRFTVIYENGVEIPDELVAPPDAEVLFGHDTLSEVDGYFVSFYKIGSRQEMKHLGPDPGFAERVDARIDSYRSRRKLLP